jgi:hypothetical protein
MPLVARFEQGSGGGGRECPLSLVSSRGVVVVGVNGPRHSFWARERHSEDRAGSGGGGRECPF